LNNLESPRPKDAPCYISMHSGQYVVHEKKIFEDLSKFSLFCPLLGPKMGQPFYLNNLIPIPQVCKSLSPWGGVIHDRRDFI